MSAVSVTKTPSAWIALFAFAAFSIANAGEHRHRNHEAVREFRATHPCPSTGNYMGHCTGWIIDHRVALCVGGSDTPDNMRWQTFDKSHEKDRWECRPGWQEKLAECERNGCYTP